MDNKKNKKPKFNTKDSGEPARATRLLLRMLWAAQPISRIELARCIGINRSTVTDIFKPLIKSGKVLEKPLLSENEVQSIGRPPVGLSFNDRDDFMIGVNLGVRHSQIGATGLKWDFSGGEEFVTPTDSTRALGLIGQKIRELWNKTDRRQLRVIGISVPGPADIERRSLVYAPHLGWENLEIADYLEKSLDLKKTGISIVVENNATASAIYEARLKLARDKKLRDYTVVRSGTGIGVGLVFDGEVYRGTGRGRGLAGEFGHMTIMAGGKPCVCGNRGCWECYASAPAASALYLGDRRQLGELKEIRFAEIVNRALAGEIRAQRTLEKVGDYLGVGIANIILGFGVPNVIVSGRLVYGWKFINQPMHEAIRTSMAGKIEKWSVESGEPQGASLGGALEIAVEEYLSRHLI